MSSSSIRILPAEVAGRIAAGEVVDRPASVVKELVENSLDASARNIVIELIDGGRERIQVTDDGLGMSPEDMRLALQRHATSKIRQAEDLLSIRTLGFRGEALPSIAAVSHMELVSRPQQARFGFRIRVEGGRVKDEGPTGAPPGTMVKVEHVFFNTPARKKQLKGRQVELARCIDTVQALALSSPHTAFQLRSDHRILLQTNGDGSIENLWTALWGQRNLVRFFFGTATFDGDGPGERRVEVYLAEPDKARTDRRYQFLVVNGRAVHSDIVRSAVESVYRHLLPIHRLPVFWVRIVLPPAEVDVNLHPRKRTIRFSYERAVATAVHDAATRALTRSDLAPRVRLRSRITSPPTSHEQLAQESHPAQGTLYPGRDAPENPSNPPGVSILEVRERDPFPSHQYEHRSASVPVRQPTDETLRSPRFQHLRPLGQIDRTYVVAEGSEGLYLIDQHAAHERVVFEQLLAGAEQGMANPQTLAVPIPIELDPSRMERWTVVRSQLERYGFHSEPFGERTVLLRTLPRLFRSEADPSTFLDLLDSIVETGGEPAVVASDLAQRTTASCKAAVKAHDPLGEEEVQALLKALDACRQPYTCPHGRPTLLVITLAELERHFRRTG